MKRSLKWSLIGAPVLAALGVGAFMWSQRPLSREYYTDADTIKSPRDEARVREILWRPPVKLSEIVNTTAEDYEPRLSWDGLTLFFVRGKPGENADIYVSRRTPASWTEPEPLTAINGPNEDLGPEPSADGNSLYFYSDRPGGQGGYDIWVSRRGDEGWLPPTNLGPLVNSEFNDYGPAITPGGERLYFASNRPQPDDQHKPNPDAWRATVREDLFNRTYDLYAAPLTERGPGQARAVESVNSPSNEGAPCVSPAGDFLYFASDRPGGSGGFDIYRARLVRGELREPTNLGPTLNTAANELDPGLAHEGFALYFSSDREPASEPHIAEKPKDYDLYFTSSREVFVDTETTARPPVDWAALVRRVLPNIMWALLAALLLLLLWALAGGVRRGKLTLLARCLLASVMLHLLLMMAFNFWRVSASVLDAFRRRGEIRVALAAPAAADIAAQIRGTLSAITPLKPSSVELVRFEQPLNTEPVDASATLDVKAGAIHFDAPAEPELAVEDAKAFEQERPPAPVVRESKISMEPALDIDTPLEVDRVEARESESTPHVAPARSVDVARPPAPGPTSQPAVDTREALLAPPPIAMDELSKTATKPVFIQVARDAPVDTYKSAAVDFESATRPVAPAPSELALKLPTTSEKESTQFEEAPPSPSAAVREIERPPLTPAVVAPDSPRPSAPQMAAEPESLAFEIPSVSQDIAPEVAARDAPVDAQTPQPDVFRPHSATANPFTLDLNLPQENEERSASTHDPVQGRVPLRGRVTTAHDGKPLAEAAVRIDLPDNELLIATTDADGRYALAVPPLPDNFAITAASAGFVPESVNIPYERLHDSDFRQDFALEPLSESVVAVEETPTVHHLGNDLWEGQINSQFQKDAEGRRFVAEFEIAESQLPPNFTRGAVQLMAKGVQCPHRIYINGLRLRQRLDSSPDDGSFGEFSAPFPPVILVEGRNTVEIRGVSCQGDVDDFEFVNVRIRLSN